MSSRTYTPIIATTVPEKARKEIAEISKDKLLGPVVQHYAKLFAPLTGAVRDGTVVRRSASHGSQKAVKRKTKKRKV
jgi:hypothetical protein